MHQEASGTNQDRKWLFDGPIFTKKKENKYSVDVEMEKLLILQKCRKFTWMWFERLDNIKIATYA